MNTILIALIGVIVLISFKGFNDESFFRKYQFHIGSIRAGEQIRMISSGFLHGDISHLFFNMFTLFSLSAVVINHFGIISFLLIYFGSLIFGSLLTLSLHKDDYNYTAIGASGAVIGIVYSAILIDPWMRIYIPIPIFGFVFGIGYLLYSIYGMKAKNDNIGHTAHFGGAIGGYLITLIKEPSMLTDNLLMVGLLAIPIVLLFVLTKVGKL